MVTPGAFKAERVLTGLGVSPGLALGTAHIPDLATPEVTFQSIPAEGIAAEARRFADAVNVSRRQLIKLKSKSAALPGSAAEEVGYLLDAHLAMLTQSRLIRGVTRRIEQAGCNAEAAVQFEIDELAESFAAIGDAYLAARIEDIRIVGARLIRNLTNTPYTAFNKLPDGTVLLADELTPADTALMDPVRITGFATVLGGAESHTAIMARALGIPAVVGCAALLGGVATGDMVIVNGSAGTVTINPSTDTLTAYAVARDQLAIERHQLASLRDVPAVTRDGIGIVLEANLELTREVEQAVAAGAAGLGLVRTEFLFMNREDLPGEDEQFEAYRELVRGMAGRPVTIRTLDIGGDKLASSLSEHLGESPNPALGLRAIRLSLRHRGLLDTQLAAILRASVEGPVRILLPMISSLTEVRATRAALIASADELRARGIAIADPLPPLGVMIEVPGAALAADAFAAEADFFALGTNDLTQYTLAIDRGDEQVAHLYNPLHPAVLRLIQFSTEAALRAGIPICVCGEIAGDPRYTGLLLGLGITSLSMSASALPRVKQRVRCIDLGAARRVAGEIMLLADEQRIARRLDDYNAFL
ncbi:MAG TPA: phosphoenolpyruvate--protein phosphotransferase [Stellaceae bacterium]|nr:phosphoenolpyruvate--protein phosphotransferase [Stellaceae bacterium]